MTAVTTRWQDVDGQYNSLYATLSISDEGILGYNLQGNIDKIKTRNGKKINHG
jgi:hypothetical protein